jgi:peptidoglycan hydrolase CwlO-like protein
MSNHRPRRAARLVVAAAVCVSAVLAGGAQPISADDVSNASSSVSQAQNRVNGDQGRANHLGNVITTLTGQIAALQTQVEQVQAAISTLDTQIAAQQKVVSDAQAKLDQISNDLIAANLALDEARRQVATDEGSLGAQIVKMYEQPPTSTVNAIFGASSFDELWQQVNAAKRVGDATQSQVDRLRQEKARRDEIVAQIAAE